MRLWNLSHEVASGSDISPCIKINKSLVVYIICDDFYDKAAYITVNPEIFARILFLGIVLKDILATGKFSD